MEGTQDVRHLSPQEVASINTNDVAFYTLLDGTVVRIKQKDENAIGEGVQFQDGEQIPIEYNQNAGEEDFKIQQNQESNIQLQNEMLQPGEKFGYYMPNEGGNIPQSQQLCTCEYQSPEGYLNYNAKLINVQVFHNQRLNQFKTLSLSNAQTFQQGQGQMKKRQLYKLVEAIPVRLSDIAGKQFINQNTNSQVYFQQNNTNTYITENASNQNTQKKIGIDSQTQIQNTQNQLNQNSASLNKEEMAQNNQQQIEQQEYQENVYQGKEGEGVMTGNEQQIEYCTCNKGEGLKNENKQQIEHCTCEKGEGLKNENKQQIEYCTCEEGEGLKKANEQQIEYCTCDSGKENEVKCNCPIGNHEMRKKFQVVSPEYVQRANNNK